MNACIHICVCTKPFNVSPFLLSPWMGSFHVQFLESGPEWIAGPYSKLKPNHYKALSTVRAIQAACSRISGFQFSTSTPTINFRPEKKLFWLSPWFIQSVWITPFLNSLIWDNTPDFWSRLLSLSCDQTQLIQVNSSLAVSVNADEGPVACPHQTFIHHQLATLPWNFPRSFDSGLGVPNY